MVILESQACGLPVIVSAFGGPKEMVMHEGNGFVVPDQKPASWLKQISEAINLFTNEPYKYSNMREKSRAATVDCADWDTILNDLLGEDLT